MCIESTAVAADRGALRQVIGGRSADQHKQVL